MPASSATTSKVYKGTTTAASGSNTLYYSFLVNLSSATSTGDYFVSLGDPGTGSSYFARLFAKSSGSGFVIGGSKLASAATATYGTAVFSFNTTYLVVVRYTFVTSSANDLMYIWLNPSLSSEPLTSNATVTIPSSDNDAGISNVGNFLWHNRSANNPVGSFDGVRVAFGSTSAIAWSSLDAYIPTPTITSFTPGSICTGGSASVVITGTNFTGATAIQFNNVNATSFIVENAGQITVTTPTGVSTGKISVTTPGGTATSIDDFIVNPLPDAAGSISGFTTVTQGDAGVAYSVGVIANASSYVWAYSGSGATITGSTENITISFDGTATSGDLTVKGQNACGDGTASETYTIAVAPQLDWANVQWPASGNISLGTSFTVYAQVYEPGVTNAAGQGANITAWIGYGTSSSDLSGYTWVPATWNSAETGSNDEYSANIGAALTSAGTYYYASRFQLGSAAYVYGGFNGGFWNGTSNVAGTLTVGPPTQIDWVNLQSPAIGSIPEGGTYNVYAKVYAAGVTNNPGQGAGITSWIGYSTNNTNPNTWTNWVNATFNADAVNDDEYMANIGTSLPAGTYYYASRFKMGLADYVYGGLGGFWNGTNSNSGVLTVIAPITTTTFTGTGTWSATGNWSNGIPTSTIDAIVDGDVTIDMAAATKDLTINSGQSVIIPSGNSLKVNGNLVNNAGAAGLVVKSGGSLIESNGVAATVERAITNAVWHLISVPNNNTTANTFFGDYLQSYDETTALWTDIEEASTLLNPVQGYDLWNMTGAAKTYTFTGALNTGIQSLPITHTAVNGINDGANLLGNPYPSYIDWSGLNGTYGAIYYWDGTAYVSWNGTGVGSQFVPPMQGFFIVAAANGTFSLSNSNRALSNAGYYKSGSELSNGIVLETMSNGYSDKLFVSFNQEATASFELQNDAYKFISNTEGLSQLYSFTGDKKLSIDVRPACETIQLGFTNDQSGEYQIGINQVDGISEATLEDTQNNIFTNLLNCSYTFGYTAGENEQRFVLHFGPMVSINEAENAVASVYTNNGIVYVDLKNNAKGDIYVYTVTGQLVSKTPAAMGSNKISLVNTGNYIVKVISDKSMMVRKVFIH